MDRRLVKRLLLGVKRGEVGVGEAMRELATLPFADLGFAKVDTHRGIRCGFPEVVYAEGKHPQAVVKIGRAILEKSGNLLITRASPEVFSAIREAAPDAEYHEEARAITVSRAKGRKGKGFVAVVTAGTADNPVAEEARVTAESMRVRTRAIYDVGVAGVHRVLAHAKVLAQASVVVVVAGMEGALASVVGGMVRVPVIAVPTSVGYGASMGGVGPLLTMLASCAPNVAVVNIDDGFGAGYIAALIVLGSRK